MFERLFVERELITVAGLKASLFPMASRRQISLLVYTKTLALIPAILTIWKHMALVQSAVTL